MLTHPGTKYRRDAECSRERQEAETIRVARLWCTATSAGWRTNGGAGSASGVGTTSVRAAVPARATGAAGDGRIVAASRVIAIVESPAAEINDQPISPRGPP